LGLEREYKQQAQQKNQNTKLDKQEQDHQGIVTPRSNTGSFENEDPENEDLKTHYEKEDPPRKRRPT